MIRMAPPPPKPKLAAPTVAPHCRRCGRATILVTEPSPLYDTETGERETGRWWMCPRFPRSWRNLWMGGQHTCVSADHAWLCQEWR